jgi:hypothetical protein
LAIVGRSASNPTINSKKMIAFSTMPLRAREALFAERNSHSKVEGKIVPSTDRATIIPGRISPTTAGWPIVLTILQKFLHLCRE